jgi:hypothetical protein
VAARLPTHNAKGTCEKCGKGPTRVFSSLCDTHYDERRARLSPGAKRGADTRRERYPHLFAPVDADKYWQFAAHQWVRKAVKRGVLPDLKSQGVACVDCGKRATLYEHRDYAHPLDVEPVCQICNLARGTAKWPTAADYNFKRIDDH